MALGLSWSELKIDSARIHALNEVPFPASGRDFVLYWCMINQRAEHNPALETAIALGNHLGLPVLCYQALRPDYPHASDRFHRFVLEGLAEFGERLEARGIPYWLELPRTPQQHQKRFEAFGRRAAVVVTDFFPAYIIPGHLRGAAKVLDAPLIAVDASCVVPMRCIVAKQVGAYALRPKLRKLWPAYLRVLPQGRSVRHAAVARRIDLEVPRITDVAKEISALEHYAIDHTVRPIDARPGGRKAALANLRIFVDKQLPRFDTARNEPGEQGQSGLSPALHFGTLFAGEVAEACLETHGADNPNVQSFLEELLVRRELSFNYCLYTPVPDQLKFSSLPPWAQKTLNDHAEDPRDARYSLAQMDEGHTTDPLWNAAQRELRDYGRIHGYLRMLWGKKILEWSPTPLEALARMAHLNDRYALDGRDAVSVANFMWVLGLHDRPFQERKVIGKVRPMSSKRTAEKYDLEPYLERYGDPASHG